MEITRLLYISFFFKFHVHIFTKKSIVSDLPLLLTAHCCTQDSFLATPTDALLFIDGEKANEERLGESMDKSLENLGTCGKDCHLLEEDGGWATLPGQGFLLSLAQHST